MSLAFLSLRSLMRILLASLFILLFAHGYGANSMDFPAYNTETVTELEGTVLSVQSFNLINQPTPTIQLIVRTNDDEVVTVELAPQWYLNSVGLSVSPYDQVHVKGSLVKLHRSDLIVASEITVNGFKVRLRTQNGVKLW